MIAEAALGLPPRRGRRAASARPSGSADGSASGCRAVGRRRDRSAFPLERAAAVAIGTFDGVHRGHRRVIEAARRHGPAPTVITFEPHPRTALGNLVELLATLERRLELLARARRRDDVVVRVHARRSRSSSRRSSPSGAARVGAEARRRRRGLPLRARAPRRSRAARTRSASTSVPVPSSRASPRPRSASPRAGEVGSGGAHARAPAGARRHRRRRRPARRHARLPDREPAVEPDLLVPAYGIYAGAALAIGPRSRSA